MEVMKPVFERLRARAGTPAKDFNLDEAIAKIKQQREEAEKKQFAVFERQFKNHALKNALGGSCIQPIHQNCRLSNYNIYVPDQQDVLNFAKVYAAEFFNGNVNPCFVFSGTVGTGKNHLAAAICFSIMEHGGLAKMTTVTELHQQLRSRCFGPNVLMTEDKFMEHLSKIDLLIIDEVGLQTNSNSQKIFIDQIINDRTNQRLPTGIITNLDFDGLTHVLGDRIMDRLQMNNGVWKNFGWQSYRTLDLDSYGFDG
ncbi:ATP-binding protein [Vibrio mediterranei]